MERREEGKRERDSKDEPPFRLSPVGKGESLKHSRHVRPKYAPRANNRADGGRQGEAAVYRLGLNTHQQKGLTARESPQGMVDPQPGPWRNQRHPQRGCECALSGRH